VILSLDVLIFKESHPHLFEPHMPIFFSFFGLIDLLLFRPWTEIHALQPNMPPYTCLITFKTTLKDFEGWRSFLGMEPHAWSLLELFLAYCYILLGRPP